MTMMVAFPHVAIIIIFIDYIFIHLICFHEYLSFFGYDVGFVDVVKFGYRTFYDTNFSVITRLYFFSVLHNLFYYVCYVFNSV